MNKTATLPGKNGQAKTAVAPDKKKTQELYATGSEHLGGIVFSCSPKSNSEDFSYLIAAKEDGFSGGKVSIAIVNQICKKTGNAYFLPTKETFKSLVDVKAAGLISGFNSCNDGDFFYWISTSSEDGSSQVMDIRDGSCKKCQPDEEHRFHLVRRG